MERGLLWLPLLAIFIGLAWAGWSEYRKLEAYRVWASDFAQAKYDIYAVIGVKDNHLTWGIPTRQGPIELQTLSLDHVKQIEVVVDDNPIDLQNPPSSAKKIALHLILQNNSFRNIPFTQIDVAVQWATFLQSGCL